eukprot:scaffold1627_cov238-Pinguiococcus_pyrenoidosus.AAC.3
MIMCSPAQRPLRFLAPAVLVIPACRLHLRSFDREACCRCSSADRTGAWPIDLKFVFVRFVTSAPSRSLMRRSREAICPRRGWSCRDLLMALGAALQMQSRLSAREGLAPVSPSLATLPPSPRGCSGWLGLADLADDAVAATAADESLADLSTPNNSRGSALPSASCRKPGTREWGCSRSAAMADLQGSASLLGTALLRGAGATHSVGRDAPLRMLVRRLLSHDSRRAGGTTGSAAASSCFISLTLCASKTQTTAVKASLAGSLSIPACHRSSSASVA